LNGPGANIPAKPGALFVNQISLAFVVSLSLLGTQAHAWGSHALASYKVFENMPEVAAAPPVAVEPLEVFLKGQEKAIEALLAAQEAWAAANVVAYPARPPALAFVADPSRSDAARRLAFLSALRIAPDSRLALYYELDGNSATDGLPLMRSIEVSTLPGVPNAAGRFVALKAGDSVSPLKVVASASYEPDFGLDINLMNDSPSDWGKVYGFGNLPFGNPSVIFSTQAPFHMGFFHEDRVLYLAAPFLKRTFPLMRVNQYTGLAALAHRSGHAYWGWRFTGLALHYVQDLTQPYHASVSPGSGTASLLWTNALAMTGFPKRKNETVVLLSNAHLALERYQSQILQAGAKGASDPALVAALADAGNDARYPAWSDTYARDVVALESYQLGAKLAQTITATVPAAYVSDPEFDFGASKTPIDLAGEIAQQEPPKKARLDAMVADLLNHFGAHSRNAVRGILKAAGR
jgi:hypothetical protein